MLMLKLIISYKRLDFCLSYDLKHFTFNFRSFNIVLLIEQFLLLHTGLTLCLAVIGK